MLRKLRSFLKLESMVAYQAARALIYMGEFDVEDVYLFDKSILEISDFVKYASMEGQLMYCYVLVWSVTFV